MLSLRTHIRSVEIGERISARSDMVKLAKSDIRVGSFGF